ncbi:hypothetical protein DBV39_08335 [Orrella marina]|uniref:Uncharacterized protein n=2 Tax=Orrella marina TaxID=2163011 RepID=A0A2R4XIR6_9BURK|nr:hypothetical protein DBV39_08335 [Orrella marina]
MPDSPKNHKASITIWYCHLAQPFDQARLALWASWLDPQETARMNRFHRQAHRVRFLVSHAMTREVIARQCGATPSCIEFRALAQGKPYISSPTALQKYFFNLTHSHDMAAIAISDSSPLGLDLEWLGRKGPDVSLAGRYFTQREYKDILKQPAHLQHQRLLRYWTLKEAYIKAEGWGLSAGLDSFEFILSDTKPPRLHICKPQATPRHAWQFQQFKLKDSHLVAIAGVAQQGETLQTDCTAWSP